MGSSLDSSPTDYSLHEALEWTTFLSHAEKCALTEAGKNKILDLENPSSWAADIHTAKLLQQETREILPLLDREALWSVLEDLPDIDDTLNDLQNGAILEIPALLMLRKWLYALECWSDLPRDEFRGERFRKDLNTLPIVTEPLKILEKILTPDGEIFENATPKIFGLFSEIRSLKREIVAVLDLLLVSLDQKGVLQDKYSDIRDGRYVLPIKFSCQHEVEGITHDASASHQTVFMEPREVALLNNRLRQRENDLLQEIYVLLKETSERLQPFGDELRMGIHLLVYWDGVHARAKLGRHYSGKPIQLTEIRSIKLESSAHPLLWWSLPTEQIIRNPLEFSEPYQTLLLTGPNTGGKTVFLKTLGLAALCAKTGFLFPGSDSPTLPFFDKIFADLGDPQSLEQHLSSFSGHILKFSKILENLTDKSLVLIDELNNATDPNEGAALGRAMLETLMEQGATVIATTHDSQLKMLATQDSRILNASFSFNESLQIPTFHLITGLPGRSRALETAERLGLPKGVLQKAKTYLSREHLEFENLLSELENHNRLAKRATHEATTLRDEAIRLKNEWTEKTQTSLSELMERVRQKLRRTFEQAQDEIRLQTQKMHRVKSRKDSDQVRSQLNQEYKSAINKFDETIREDVPEIASLLISSQSNTNPETQDIFQTNFQIGDRVRIPKWKNTGTILSLFENKAKVSMGNLQMTLELNELEPLNAEKSKKLSVQGAKTQKRASFIDNNRPHGVPSQLDLRGLSAEEALLKLEHYLDQAFRSGEHTEVIIIHGLGTGVLREETRKFLRTTAYVKGFKDGGSIHGGTGATVVELEST